MYLGIVWLAVLALAFFPAKTSPVPSRPEAATIFLTEIAPGEPAGFYHLRPGKGAEQNSITHIAQDKQNQMWFATKEGVVRYNGNRMFHYRHEPGNSRSPAGNFIERVFIARNGGVWVGTEPAALHRYVPETDDFERIPGIRGQRVKDIVEDTTGRLWLTTDIRLYRYDPAKRLLDSFAPPPRGTGLDRLLLLDDGRLIVTTNETYVYSFDTATGQFVKFPLLRPEEKQNTRSTATYSAYQLTRDHNGDVWFATHNGFLIRWQPETGALTRYVFARKWDHDPHKLTVMFIMEDSRHNIWFGTWFHGLYKLLPGRRRFQRILPDPERKNAISNSIVHSGFEDRDGNLWFGTEFSGLNILRKKNKFRIISSETYPGLPAAEYGFAVKDSAGDLWVGALSQGIYRLPAGQKAFVKARGLNEHPYSYAAYAARDGSVWFGSRSDLIRRDPQGNIHHFRHRPGDYNSILPGTVIDITAGRNGTLWSASTAGLTSLNPATGKIKRFVYDEHNPGGLSGPRITALAVDRHNRLWVGTRTGLNKWNRQSGDFIKLHPPDANRKDAPVNSIRDLAAQGENIWLATAAGLVRYDTGDKTFRTFGRADGLDDINIKSVIPDDHGHIWFATKNRIIRRHAETGQYVTYDASDGLSLRTYIPDLGWQDLDFTNGFAYKDRQGYLYFGGIGGIAVFHPDSLIINRHPPTVMIESFQINGKDTSLHGPLTLHGNQNHLRFVLAAQNYIQPRKNQFAYRLDPYDRQWHYARYNNVAEYHNLPPGRYVFRYMAANNDGIWSPEYRTSVLRIRPALWTTYHMIVFLLILLLLAALLLFMYRKWRRLQIEQQKKKLRYRTSNLKKEDAERILEKLREVFPSQSLHLEADLSLYKLAEKLKEKPHHVSQVINQYFKKNFHDFINTFRVEEAKRLLRETHLKIEAVAYDSGFNSLSTFHTAFKKETGMTPSAFRKKHREMT